MNDEIKALLEELQLPEDTGTKISELLSEAFEKAKEDGKEEGKKEAEEKASKDAEEKDKEHEDEIAELKEAANAYGDFLKGKANEYGSHIKDSITEKVKEYADFAVEQFIAENKERFVETEEYARIKSAFSVIKEAFEQNGFDVREDAHAQELQQSLEESTEEYEKIFEELQAAKGEVDSLKRTMILEKATSDLAETQKEKVNELLENVTFESTEEFEEGISLIVEQAKTQTVTVVATDDVLMEDNTSVTPGKTINPSVARYLSGTGLL